MMKSTILSLLGLVMLTGCNGDWCAKNKSAQHGSDMSDVVVKVANDDPNAVYFAFDNSKVDEKGLAVIKAQAEALKSAKATTITGHCSKEGTPAYNVGLGERRADAASKALKSAGFAGDVKCISYGKSTVFVEGDTEAELSQNRRAQFHHGDVVLPNGQAAAKKAKSVKKAKHVAKAAEAEAHVPAVAQTEAEAVSA